MRRLHGQTIDTVEGYWTGEFELDRDELRPERARVVMPRAYAWYPGVYVMSFGRAPILAAPPHFEDLARAAADGWVATHAPSPDRMGLLLGDYPCEVIGPALVCYGDRGTLASVSPSKDLRALDWTRVADFEHASRLRGIVGRTPWEHGGPKPESVGDGRAV